MLAYESLYLWRLTLLPKTVFPNIQNPHIIPKLKPRERVAHQGLSPLVEGIVQRVLRIDLILRLRTTELSEQTLLLHPSFGDAHSQLRDLIVPFSLLQGAPTLAHLKFDLILPKRKLTS